MKKILYIIAAAAMMLAGCSKESETNEGGALGTPLKITVAVDNPAGGQTRAADNGYATTFETDDAIGIWVYGTGTTVATNLKWVKQAGGKWEPATDADNIYYHGKALTIRAYFPYQTGTMALPEPTTFTVQADQTTTEAYRKSDLLLGELTWNGETGAQPLTFEHAMALVEVVPSSVAGLESVTLYAKLSEDGTATAVTLFPFVDGSYRAVLPEQTLNTSIGFAYNTPDFYSYTVNPAIVAGQYTRFEVKTTAAIGDFYYQDGSYSSVYDNLKPCVGIVFRAKTSTQKGLVVSLDEGQEWWSIGHEATGATSPDDGAANMMQIQDYITTNSKSWSDYPAFNWCRSHGSGTQYEGQWYLPATDELKALQAVYQASTNGFNAQLSTASGTALNANSQYYWSSSEWDDYGAASTASNVAFNSGSMNGDIKNNIDNSVRAVLAF